MAEFWNDTLDQIYRSPERTIRYHFLSEHFQIIQCHQYIEKNKSITEVFPDSWLLFFLRELNSSKMSICSKGKTIELKPETAVLVPAFSIVKWQLQLGASEWWAYRSLTPLPIPFQRKPLLIKWNLELNITHEQQIFEYIQNNMAKAEIIETKNTESVLAQKIKSHIDDNFREDLSFADIAKNLNCSQTTLSHSFRKCFGLTPIKYCNQLKMHASIINMSFANQNVTDSCYASGFNDFSRFYRNIKGYFQTPPSAFLTKDKGC